MVQWVSSYGSNAKDEFATLSSGLYKFKILLFGSKGMCAREV